jgi:hypothetical protein
MLSRFTRPFLTSTVNHQVQLPKLQPSFNYRKMSTTLQETTQTGSTIGQVTSKSTEYKTVQEMIVADHQRILKLWKWLQRIKNSPKDKDLAQKVLNTLLREVSIHSAAEELVVYHMMDHKGLGKIAEENRSEHLKVKELLYEVDKIYDVTSPEIWKPLESAMVSLEDHIHHEETREVLELSQKLTEAEQKSMIGSFHTHRMMVPTRIHPQVPDDGGFAEEVVGMVVGATDKARDLFREFVDLKDVPEMED